jgi:serine/threonine protein kinase
MQPLSADFEGTERFQVKDHLGSGTSGEVYCVYDTKLRSYVALKTLQRADPAAIYRFKNEFRALADVSHPNLVQLYELSLDGDRWFFTMELIDGWDFLEYCRQEPPPLDPRTEPEPSPPPDMARLRDSMRQLATGLAALHREGKLHCDIKPTNIRVSQEGRVVLLDFGLVQELFHGVGDRTVDAELTGTPAYMSPEQAAGQRLNEATDWYSVGVILYEALTGLRPFYGGFLQVLQKKQILDPKGPEELLPSLPEDLTKLCKRLLHRDPTKRPTGDKILRMLGQTADSRVVESQRGSMSGDRALLLGREEHLSSLNDAFDHTRRGKATVVYVHGSSGMGKSALAEQFIKQVKDNQADSVVLKGRCYERESMPYKALDSLIDALSRYLNRLPKAEVEALLPANVQALGRLFPALRRLQPVMRAQRKVLDIPEEREQKRRARTALRELLERLAHRKPLVLYIDDLQWGDRDSAELISEILQPPDPPPLLLLGTYRSEDKDSSPLLEELLDSPQVHEGAHIKEIAVEELLEEDAYQLALHLLGERSAAVDTVARVIARESGGSPYFVAELVRYARSRSRSDSIRLEMDSAGMTLGRLILARLEKLTPEANRLLEVVTVAGHPLDLEVAIQAAELGSAAQAAVTILRAASLIRIRRLRNYDEIEAYHTRIREEVVCVIPKVNQRKHHANLALALEASDRSDPETLAMHFREAGDLDREVRYTIAAADQAYEALAFSHAARLYHTALDLAPKAEVPLHQLLVRLGDSLANSGHGAASATPYLQAAKSAKTAEEALELRRRAAEQQLLSGHIDAGLKTFDQVLESIGMAMPRTPIQTGLSIIVNRAKLWLRGLKFKETDASQISQDQLLSLDACRSVATGLSNVDTLRGLDFGTRYLLLSLKAGEPFRVALAFAIEGGFSGAGGTKARTRTHRLLQLAGALAERVGNPEAIGLTLMTQGAAAYFEGQGPKAVETFERAEKILREQCTGVTWQIDTLMHWKFRLLIFLGKIKRVQKELPAISKDFIVRGDIYADSTMRSVVSWFMRLAADQPDEAQREIRHARQAWSQDGFHLQHYLQLIGQVEIALYRNDGLSAWAALEELWGPLQKSGLLIVLELTRAEALHLRARGALGAAVALGVDSPQSKKVLGPLKKVLKRLSKQASPWAKPWHRLVSAGLSSFEGRKSEAIESLVAAEEGFSQQHMNLYAAVSRYRHGQLMGEEGLRLIVEATDFMESEGIKNPARMADALAPGGWD